MQHKKQAFNLIEDICRINEHQWDNHAGSYDDKKESAYQIEEALEGFKSQDRDVLLYTYPYNAKNVSRQLVNELDVEPNLRDVDRFDKHLDSIYYNIGSLHKLGLTPTQIIDGLQIVHNANKEKSGEKDSLGKVKKSKDFTEPEPLLQKILNKRNMD
jgi:predicted HAD superfamily Cof-like phosphohydrolase